MSAFPVTLQWPGRTEPKSAVVASAAGALPERDMNYLLGGDNLSGLSALQNRWAGRFTLAYLDPPFLTGKQHSKVTRKRTAKGAIERRLTPAFDDRWQNMGEYLSSLGPRIERVRELLAPNGCMVLHVDPKTSHYLKVLCDEIFGPGCFASEIIWRYRRWPAKTQNFQRVHDVLLRYVKDPRVAPRFTTLYEPLAPSTLATWGDRKQRAVLDADGRRARSSKRDEPTPGAPMGDVWEIGIVAPVARERTGYPTQKPEALLERLITSCTAPHDWILDPYVGSGTSMAVADRLKRRAVGIDSSAQALAVTRQRLADLQCKVQLVPVSERPVRSTRNLGIRKAS